MNAGRTLGLVTSVALALWSFSVVVSAPASAGCSYLSDGRYVCEDAPLPTAQTSSDNCEKAWYNPSCEYCKLLPQTFPQQKQPKLPCDHSRYE